MVKQQVIYSATQTINGPVQRKVEETSGLLPYFVSGPLHHKSSIPGGVGAVLHVGAWILALVMDILARSKLAESDKLQIDFWTYSFVVFMVGFGILLGATLLHITNVYVIPEGKMMPSAKVHLFAQLPALPNRKNLSGHQTRQIGQLFFLLLNCELPGYP